jgi:hypothetical protein
MKRMGAVVIVLGGVLGLSAVALGALPKKGGTYVGDIKASPFTLHIDIRVNPAGTKLAHFTYLCGTGRPATTVFGIPIDRTGHFKFTKMTGSVVVWKMAGRFLSATRAFVSLNSLACGGSKGSTTITLKR